MKWGLAAEETSRDSRRWGGSRATAPQLGEATESEVSASSPYRRSGQPGLSHIQLFMILARENCRKPIAFLTAVLTWGGRWQGGWRGAFHYSLH